MNLIKEIVAHILDNILARKLRSLLTMFGIAWGIASFMLMIAVGDGFRIGYREQMKFLGADIAIIWGGRTTDQVGDQRAGRYVRLSYDDVLAISRDCYYVKHVSPELDRVLNVKSPFNTGLFTVDGVAAIYQEIRTMTLSQGRLMDDSDFNEARRICVIGSEVKKQLCAGQQAVGTEIRIEGISFLVVGELKHKEQNSSYNGLDDHKILVPFTTMQRDFPDPRPSAINGSIKYLVIVPVSEEKHHAALAQVKSVLGRIHGFEPADEGALWVWDTLESVRLTNVIFDSMQLFLGFIAVVTLSLGGIGVMNIMLISVAERTREIGLKKALGARKRRILAEFFLESLTLTVASGVAGILFALAVSFMVGGMELPAYFSGLPISRATALLAFLTLATVAVLSGIYPASRASKLSPVEALRYE